MDLRFEKRIWKKGYEIIIGIDEAGRGPLAGPVFAGAVAVSRKLLKKDKGFKFLLKQVNDSKKLSVKKREKLYKELIKSPFIIWAEGRVGPKIIDRINILQATKLAMKRAICNLNKKLVESRTLQVLWEKSFLLIDGNFSIDLDIQCRDISQKAIVKGDQKVFSIAAASIIAKVRRDRLMIKYAKRFPQYNFEKHKGYPTKLHRKMLTKYGFCKIHRKSFDLGLCKEEVRR